MRSVFGQRQARWIGLATAVLCTFVVLHIAARNVIARAIVDAPNKRVETRAPPPPERARPLVVRHAFDVGVGPPAARMSGWILDSHRTPSATPPKTVLVLHGVRSDRVSLLGTAEILCNAGYRVVLPDLRGHGASSGAHLTYGLLEARDLQQLIDELERNGWVRAPLGVFGFSYGAAAALQLAARDPRVRAVVAVAGFSNLRQIVRDYRDRWLPFGAAILPNGWLDSAIDRAAASAGFDADAADTRRAASLIRVPVLLAHGALDLQVPAHHADQIGRALRGPVRRIDLPGRDHAALLHSAQLMTEATAWFAERL